MAAKKKQKPDLQTILQQRQYISIPQLADLLGISRIAVYKKVKKGQIESIRVGRNFAVSTEYIRKNLVDLKTIFTEEPHKEDINTIADKTMHDFKDVFRKLGKK